MISQRPLADLRTERPEPTGSTAPRSSLRLLGVPVPSRALGFSAWQGADRLEAAFPVQPAPAKLYRIDGRPWSASTASSHAA
jgi:hypothetical protein